MRAFARWIKNNPIVVLLGTAATIVGLIKGVPPAWSAATEMMRIPECLTYADTYFYSGGSFERKLSSREWIEHGRAVFNFRETHRDRNFIVLLNETPRKDAAQDMILRIPVCGGTIQWTYENPEYWTNLYESWR